MICVMAKIRRGEFTVGGQKFEPVEMNRLFDVPVDNVATAEKEVKKQIEKINKTGRQGNYEYIGPCKMADSGVQPKVKAKAE